MPTGRKESGIFGRDLIFLHQIIFTNLFLLGYTATKIVFVLRLQHMQTIMAQAIVLILYKFYKFRPQHTR